MHHKPACTGRSSNVFIGAFPKRRTAIISVHWSVSRQSLPCRFSTEFFPALRAAVLPPDTSGSAKRPEAIPRTPLRRRPDWGRSRRWAPTTAPRGRTARLWWLRWRNLVATSWFMFIPLVAIVLFTVAMGVILWSLHETERQQQRDALYRDAAWAQQRVRLSLLSNQDQLASLARDIAAAQLDQGAYRTAAQEILRENPEIVFINWLDATKRGRWSLPSTSEFASRLRENHDQPLEPEVLDTFDAARETQRVVYSRPLVNERGDSFMLMEVPIVRDNEFLGTLGALYSINGILTHLLPPELTERYRFSLIDKNNQTRASTSLRPVPGNALSYEVLLDPPGHSLSLRADAYPPASNLPNNMLLCWWWGCRASCCGACGACGATPAAAPKRSARCWPRPRSGARWKTRC